MHLHELENAANRHVFGFSRQRACLYLAISRTSLTTSPDTAISRISAMAEVLAWCEPGTRGLAEFSDGEHSGDGIVSMCGCHAGSILIPDNEFIQSRGYSRLRGLTEHTPAFEERRDLVLWRGSTTGATGAISLPGMTADMAGLLQRTRMCLLLRDVAGCDVRVTDVVQTDDVLTHVRRLAEAGILGHYVDPMHWLDARYHVAVDGNSLAWSSTFTRLLMGCCIIKPDNPQGYRQWYSSRFKAWEHYVPAAADLHDLVERIQWCRSNTRQAARIAANGRALALALDWGGEITTAARRIDAAHRDGKLARDELNGVLP